jgi:hypothetical protein
MRFVSYRQTQSGQSVAVASQGSESRAKKLDSTLLLTKLFFNLEKQAMYNIACLASHLLGLIGPRVQALATPTPVRTSHRGCTMLQCFLKFLQDFASVLLVYPAVQEFTVVLLVYSPQR